MICNALIRYYLHCPGDRDDAPIIDAYQQAFNNNPRLSSFVTFLSSQVNPNKQLLSGITPAALQAVSNVSSNVLSEAASHASSSTTSQTSSHASQHTQPSLLYPVHPGSFCNCALCSPLTSLDAAVALTQRSPYLAEHKFDGVRIQLHRTDDGVTLFGRSGEVSLRQPPQP